MSYVLLPADRSIPGFLGAVRSVRLCEPPYLRLAAIAWLDPVGWNRFIKKENICVCDVTSITEGMGLL